MGIYAGIAKAEFKIYEAIRLSEAMKKMKSRDPRALSVGIAGNVNMLVNVYIPRVNRFRVWIAFGPTTAAFSNVFTLMKNIRRLRFIREYLCCAVCAIAFGPVGTGLRASAQTPSNDLSFEVATVKPVDPSYRFDGKRFWAHVNPAGASYWYMTPANLVSYAYDVQSFQVTGPEWANADHFDIEARFPAGADKKDDRKMLQALLKDRFKLAFHIEKRPLDRYVLAIGKNGEKLKPSPPEPASPEADTALKSGENNAAEGSAKPKITTTADGTSKLDQGKKGTFSVKFDQEHWANHLEFSKMTMEQLAQRLSNCLGSGVSDVVDETGIKGNYQVALDCPLPGPRPAMGGDAAGSLPSDPQDGSLLIQSLDALGLKLEKRKILQDVYVIDHVERPSEN